MRLIYHICTALSWLCVGAFIIGVAEGELPVWLLVYTLLLAIFNNTFLYLYSKEESMDNEKYEILKRKTEDVEFVPDPIREDDVIEESKVTIEDMIKNAVTEALNKEIKEMLDIGKAYCLKLGMSSCGGVCESCYIEALYDAGYRLLKQGHWIVTQRGCVINCSECGERLEMCYPDGTEIRKLPYCPFCGAKMVKH